MRIIVTGAAGAVGRKVCELLPFASEDATVLAVDRRPMPGELFGVDTKVVDLQQADLDDLLDGGDVLVHLASGIRPDGKPAEGEAELATTLRLLDAAGRAGISHLVVLSTAMVYGAWPDSPVPLTEDAWVRPNPGYSYAVQRADLERAALQWRARAPGRIVTILRPAVTVGEEKPGGLAKVLKSAAKIRSEAGDAPAQYLHVVDLAAAIVLAVVEGVDGILNVAPDGWLSAEQVAALEGPAPRLRLPHWLTDFAARLPWRLKLRRTPPGIMPYTIHPWVVANDRLRSLGWSPTHSNEEAYVAGHAPGPLDKLNARRRQQIALAGASVVVVGLLGGLGAAGYRIWKRRRG